MPTFKTGEGLADWINDVLLKGEHPFYEAICDSWKNEYSDVDLIIDDKGVKEVHDIQYTGRTYEITITTRQFKDEETRGRYE